ncbi:MAG: hypothetical protein HY648_11190 [Acidobacteria bacterium]|nr:hypothetical protein [Acidobacteriota bacterium]
MKTQKLALFGLVLWLGAAVILPAHETGFPEATLKKVFPEATGFTVRKKTLSSAQLQRVEQLAGSKVQRNDNPFTFYVALGKSADGSGVLGTVVFVDAAGPKGAVDLAIGFQRDGSVSRVVLAENKDDPGLSASAFLDQFKGKTTKSPLALGQDVRYAGEAAGAKAVLQAVKRGMFLLQTASSS